MKRRKPIRWATDGAMRVYRQTWQKYRRYEWWSFRSFVEELMFWVPRELRAYFWRMKTGEDFPKEIED